MVVVVVVVMRYCYIFGSDVAGYLYLSGVSRRHNVVQKSETCNHRNFVSMVSQADDNLTRSHGVGHVSRQASTEWLEGVLSIKVDRLCGNRNCHRSHWGQEPEHGDGAIVVGACV